MRANTKRVVDLDGEVAFRWLGKERLSAKVHTHARGLVHRHRWEHRLAKRTVVRCGLLASLHPTSDSIQVWYTHTSRRVCKNKDVDSKPT